MLYRLSSRFPQSTQFTSYSCVSNCCRAVIQYCTGHLPSRDEAAIGVGLDTDGATYEAAAQYLRANQCKVVLRKGKPSLKGLAAAIIDNKVPLVSGVQGGTRHALVVTAVDPVSGELVFMDPSPIRWLRNWKLTTGYLYVSAPNRRVIRTS